MRIAVIGAGLSGLACAEALAASGRVPVLFEKSAGVGGRMSTRRLQTPLDEAGFDHGAQYFTVRDPGFGAVVAAWRAAGLAAPWPQAGEAAWVGVPTMNAPMRALAERREVRRSQRINRLERLRSGWRLLGEGVAADPYDAVVVALPAEQAAALLGPVAPSLAQVAADTPSAPCWTVMASWAVRLPIEADVVRHAGAIGWAARNSAKPGRGGPESWVLQAGSDWSRENLEQAADRVRTLLPSLLGEALGLQLPEPIAARAHRWRYSRSGDAARGHLWSPEDALGVCGDWLLGPRVECAWRSGTGLAAAIAGA